MASILCVRTRVCVCVCVYLLLHGLHLLLNFGIELLLELVDLVLELPDGHLGVGGARVRLRL